MIRILVVDDSLTMRKLIVEVLSEHPDFEVVGEADNGKNAVHLAQSLSPDVITMDMMMPEMNGASATEYIMAHCPTRILIVSSSTNRGELMKTYDALAAGAISVIEKPMGHEDDGAWENNLINELKIVSRIPVIHHIRGATRVKPKPFEQTQSPSDGNYKMIVMGASTGGPQALMHIFKQLPPDFPVPILCVLHISDTFVCSLDEWFCHHCSVKVQFATDNLFLNHHHNGHVFLAPAGYHLVLDTHCLRLIQTPARNFCRPSVDVLFESAAHTFKSGVVGVLLTGMGRDGAFGLKQIHDAGGYTIAQDQESSTVYGMNKAAIDAGAAQRVLPYTKIAEELIRMVT